MNKLPQLLEEIRDAKAKVLLAYSGGKDSTFVLKYLVENGIDVVAYMLDNSFLAEEAIANARKVCSKLDCRLIIDFLPVKNTREQFKKSLDGDFFTEKQKNRASDICNVCMYHINTKLLKFAIGNNIHYICGGYLSGQVPTDSVSYKLSVNTYFSLVNQFEKTFFDDTMTNDKIYAGTITFINPLLELKKKESDILNEIATLGWIKPKNTGFNSTNCLVNDYAIKQHIKKYGVHPYKEEISNQLRDGTITPEEADLRLNYDYSKILDVDFE